MNTTNEANREPVAGPVERPVRPLLERLREAAQGEELFGFDGLRDEPDALLTEAANALERAEASLRALLATCEALAEQQAMPDDFWRVDAHMAALALRAINQEA